MPLQVGLKLLDPVSVISTLTPDDLEGIDDLLDRAIDRRALVAEQTSLETDMSQFNRRIGHNGPSFLGSDVVEDRVDHSHQDDQGDDRDDR